MLGDSGRESCMVPMQNCPFLAQLLAVVLPVTLQSVVVGVGVVIIVVGIVVFGIVVIGIIGIVIGVSIVDTLTCKL